MMAIGSGCERAEATSFVGPYRILGLLGRGGMGVVCRGQHRETGEVVAVKTVRAPSAILLACIRREIHALSRLRHPGVARIVGEGLHEGMPYYAMELYEGETLRGQLDRVWSRGVHERSGLYATISAAVLTEARVPTARMAPARGVALGMDQLAAQLTLIRNACEILSFVHGEGAVHGDLKPDNLLVRPDGRPVLVDFGIASSPSSGGRDDIGAGEAQGGSLTYMAPEQVRGELLDARTDLYALGVILYEALTGRAPFLGATAAAIRYQQLSEAPSPPSQYNPDVPAALDSLVLQLLAKRPDDRLGYAQDVSEALAALGVPADAFPERTARPRAYLYRSDLVGRTEALGTLVDALDHASTGRGGRYYLSGESGIGKTRLAMEVARFAARERMAVIAGQCAPLAPLLGPFRPLLQAVANAARAGVAAVAEVVSGPAGKLLAAYEPTLAALPMVVSQSEPAALPPDSARARLFEALGQVTMTLATVRPVLLVLDDLQWADELSIGALASFAAKGANSWPVVILGTYRTEDRSAELAALVSADGAIDVALGRLDFKAVAAMVSGMLALREPPDDLVGFLSEQSDGNPFFVAEYLLAAIAEGLLTRDGAGRWVLHAREGGADVLASAVPLPRSLAELVKRRLDTLGEAAGRLVARASVLGREIDSTLLAASAGLPDDTLLEALEELRVRQVLEVPAPGRLRFVHDKIRETAYEQLAPEERRALHRTAAFALQAQAAEVAEAWPNLGHHFARAGIPDRASHYLARAADRARAGYANVDALQLYRAALREGRAASQPLGRLCESIGEMLAQVGRHDEARLAFQDALREPPELDRLGQSRLHRKIGKTLERLHRADEALAAYDAAEAALGDLPKEASDEGRAWQEEWVHINIDRVMACYWSCRKEQLETNVENIRQAVKARGTPVQRAHFFKSLTYLNLRRENFALSLETVGYARDALAASLALGHEAEALDARFMLAFALLFHGSLAEAEERLRATIPMVERAGELTLLSRFLAYLLLLQRRRGSTSEVRSLAPRCRAVAEAANMTEYVGAVQAHLGWLALHDGELSEAKSQAEAALALWSGLTLANPLQWLARMPLLVVALREARLADAVAQARAVLAPLQHQLPDPLHAALTRGIDAWDAGRNESVHAYLSEAAVVAGRSGFL